MEDTVYTMEDSMNTFVNDILDCAKCSSSRTSAGKGLCSKGLCMAHSKHIAQLFELLRKKAIEQEHYFANSAITNTANQSQETKAISNANLTHLHIFDKDGDEIDVMKHAEKGLNLNSLSSLISMIMNISREGGTSDINSGIITT